jgi:hypothetical protein
VQACTLSVRHVDRAGHARRIYAGYGSCVLPCPPTPLRKESLKIQSPWYERPLARSALVRSARCPKRVVPAARTCRPLSLLILPLIHSQRIASAISRIPAGSPDLTTTGPWCFRSGGRGQITAEIESVAAGSSVDAPEATPFRVAAPLLRVECAMPAITDNKRTRSGREAPGPCLSVRLVRYGVVCTGPDAAGDHAADLHTPDLHSKRRAAYRVALPRSMDRCSWPPGAYR